LILVAGGSICHFIKAMQHWSSKRILALSLAVLLALGMSMSALYVGQMSAQMAMASAAAASGQGACGHLGGRGDGTSALSCPSMLYCSCVAILPADRGIAVRTASEPFASISWFARDLATPPDPYPPRTPTLG